MKVIDQFLQMLVRYETWRGLRLDNERKRRELTAGQIEGTDDGEAKRYIQKLALRQQNRSVRFTEIVIEPTDESEIQKESARAHKS